MRVGAKARIQYGLARILLTVFGLMPRPVAYRAGYLVAAIGYRLAGRQRRVALRNLRLALPELSEGDHQRIVRDVFRNLGRLLVEFSHLPRLTPENIRGLVHVDGLDNYLEALGRGKGTLFLTAHLGAWELGPYAHAVYGYPVNFLTRPIDNPLVEDLVTRIRTGSGNRPIKRTHAVRDVLKALRNNEAVGILIDQNTMRGECVFADFFGIPAATTPGLATFALRTGATVLPAFVRWNPEGKHHILRFERPVELVASGNREQDVLVNTRLFNSILERLVREAPEQWLWIHQRWKTRPEGEPSLYR